MTNERKQDNRCPYPTINFQRGVDFQYRLCEIYVFNLFCRYRITNYHTFAYARFPAIRELKYDIYQMESYC